MIRFIRKHKKIIVDFFYSVVAYALPVSYTHLGYAYSRRESRGGAVMIEEYLEGPEFSVEVMVIDGEPHVLQITDKLTTGAPHFVEMGHSQPARQTEEAKEKITDLACRAVKAVGISCGPAHVEMILTKQGPKMVELGARMGAHPVKNRTIIMMPATVGSINGFPEACHFTPLPPCHQGVGGLHEEGIL